MNNQSNWISTRVRLGWALLAVGVVLAGMGVWLEFQYLYVENSFRILTGLGILLAGVGIGFLVRYRPALKDSLSARRLNAEEGDERTVLIRARAGNRAYWVSAALIYIGLMWVSFSWGGLPEMGSNALWYYLAACVLIPFGVYIASILIDERNL